MSTVAEAANIPRRTGEQWIEKITPDVLDCIMTFMAVKSLVNLGMTCKRLQELVEEHRLVWLRVVQAFEKKYSLAPRSVSFSTLDSSMAELRLIATRQDRLKHFIRSRAGDPGNIINTAPNDLIFTSARLDHSSLRLSPGSRNLVGPPTLLPGGRWLISFIVGVRRNQTHILCWDISQLETPTPMPDGLIRHETPHLTPVAHASVDGMLITTVRRKHSIQLDSGGDAVNITVQVTRDHTLSQLVFQLMWTALTEEAPVLQLVNSINLPHRDFSAFVLEGSYIVINSIARIVVWDWKSDVVVEIDLEESWLASGVGFSLAVQPPYIVVIPPDPKTILYLRIPEEQGQSTRDGFPLVQASHRIELPLLKDGQWSINPSTLHILSHFTPYEQRCSQSRNLIHVRIHPNNHVTSYTDIIVNLKDLESGPQAPKVVRQSLSIFAHRFIASDGSRLPPLSFPDDTVFRLCAPYHISHQLAASKRDLCTLEFIPFVPRRGNFVKSLSVNIDFPAPPGLRRTRGRDWVGGALEWPGYLDGVSGVGVAAIAAQVISPSNFPISILKFR